MFWTATLLFLWEYEFIGGTPYVAVVGGNAYLNWTIRDLTYNKTRAIRNPVGNASVMIFFIDELNPYIFDNRVTFTGNLSQGIVSFQISNVKLSDAGKYTFITYNNDSQATLGGQVLVVAESPNISGITSLSLLAVAGKEYKINCSTESRSAPLDHNLSMYSEWRANGVNINIGSGYSVNGTILTIINLTKEDNGAKFTCRTFEDQRRISGESSSLVLNVLYGPDNVQVSPFGDLTVDEGESINITCTGECNPPCSTYQWQKDSKPTVVGFSQSYLVPNIKRNHSGVYICIASNTNIPKNATAQIIVRVNYGPDAGSITLSPNQTSYETEEFLPLSVNCSADCYPNCQYRWTGPGVGNFGNTGMLFIQEIKRNQTGLFKCTATNPKFTSTSAETTISVTVLYGPDADSITLSPNQISFEQLEYSSFSVKCSANCYRTCRYKWSGPEAGDYGVYGNTGVLSIPEIKRDNAGVFTCTATNPGIISKSATATIFVTILYPPTVSIESRNGSFREMEFMINCTAHGIPERYNYSLIHSSLFSGIKIQQLIDNVPFSTGVLVHWLRNPSFMDTGIYTCIVRNGIMDYRDNSLDKNTSVAVWITGPPNITSSDTDFYADKGYPGILVVEFYNSMLHGVTVTWNKLRNHTLKKLESSDKYNISVAGTNVTVKFYSVLIQQPGFIATLEIHNVTEEDFSPYLVYLQNTAGNSSMLTLNLKPRESNKEPIANNRADEVVIGGSVGAVVLSIAVAVVVIMYRRRSERKRDSTGKPLELNVRSEEINNHESGLVDNPVYEASDPRLNPSNSKGSTVAEYAAVVKDKKRAVLVEDPSKLYAQVDKSNTNVKKGDLCENTDLVGKGKIAGSEYENSRQIRTEAFDGNIYENPGSVASECRLVNKDGLLYADLMLGPSATKNGKVVIHGIENRTEYADIAYGKSGEPHPDSDEDENDRINVKK